LDERAPTPSSAFSLNLTGHRRYRGLVYEVEETMRDRTQEVGVEVSDDGGPAYRQILVQEYNFSPRGTLLHGLIVWRRGVEGVGGRARS
jgi:hypothetical protein